MSSTTKPRARRLKRGTKTEDYLAALSGEDGASSSSTSASSSSKQQQPAISSMDSPFEVQEYLAMLVAENPHDIQRLIQIPRWKRNSSNTVAGGDTNRAKDKGKQAAIDSDSLTNSQDAPSADLNGDDRASKGQSSDNEDSQQEGIEDDDNDEYEYVDRDVWLYEHLRRLAIDLSQPFVVTLQEHCSRETCPEMKAGEWLYLCAAHATANETECCAIDYITHTLDGATALLNSSRYFPSRINIPPTSLKHFTSIARRLYRIFAHAWYHHRELFDICESSTSLYERFLALSIEYDLVPRELLTIPSQHEQLSEEDPTSSSSTSDNTESNHETSREHRSNTIFSRSNGGPRLNGYTKEAQEAKEEEEHNQIQRRILEKRVLGPGYTSSGGKQGVMNGQSNSLGAPGEDDEDDDDSSEESSDEESMSMPPTASMAGLSLNANASGNKGSGNTEQKTEDEKTAA